ncbi:hypothetical protein [Enterococcus sp. DIV1420a]|uniref:hypothetical protein n=1 Tax=Enterococcus sp. DIV1420a TaxID=2774672 RepID=UPI003F688055
MIFKMIFNKKNKTKIIDAYKNHSDILANFCILYLISFFSFAIVIYSFSFFNNLTTKSIYKILFWCFALSLTAISVFLNKSIKKKKKIKLFILSVKELLAVLTLLCTILTQFADLTVIDKINHPEFSNFIFNWTIQGFLFGNLYFSLQCYYFIFIWLKLEFKHN